MINHKLTVKETLYYTWKLWEYIATLGVNKISKAVDIKLSWNGWKELVYCINACPCCEYTYQHNRGFYLRTVYCDICPLLPLWGKGESTNMYACESSLISPYSMWDTYREPIYAKQIADFAEKEYKKFIKEKK